MNLYGTSYGTRVAQAFMARHPSRIRTVSLKGVVPQSMSPESHARAGDDAWRSWWPLVEDAVCEEAFPDHGRD